MRHPSASRRGFSTPDDAVVGGSAQLAGVCACGFGEFLRDAGDESRTIRSTIWTNERSHSLRRGRGSGQPFGACNLSEILPRGIGGVCKHLRRSVIHRSRNGAHHPISVSAATADLGRGVGIRYRWRTAHVSPPGNATGMATAYAEDLTVRVRGAPDPPLRTALPCALRARHNGHRQPRRSGSPGRAMQAQAEHRSPW